MLQSLCISNLAVVDRLDIDFHSGFNVLSGETGAGKSVIIGALQLILGERADKSSIRTGEDRCEVSGIFDFQQRPSLHQFISQFLEEAGLPYEDDQLILRRVITQSGSRHYINNTPTPLSALRELARHLVAIHGPNDNQTLTRTHQQRLMLDQFGIYPQLQQKVAEVYEAIQLNRNQLADIRENIPTPEEVAHLKKQIKEIEEVDVAPDEDTELGERHKVAAHSKRLVELVYQVRDVLTEDRSAVTLKASALHRSLIELGQLDPENAGTYESRLFEIVDQLQELSNDLEVYGASVDIDPYEFQEMEERLREITALKRKYGPTLEAVNEFLQRAYNQIDLFENAEDRLNKLEKAYQALLAQYDEAAIQLTAARQAAAQRLGQAITEKLQLLGFLKSDFQIMIEPIDHIHPDGRDHIEFCFSPNPGEALQPLRKIASSGEIARVMLAVKTVLAQVDEMPLLVFDEIDANVGGKTAHMVGKELAALGHGHQVLCISHLPQVAAHGACHMLVAKEVIDERTRTSIRPLSEEERVDELARMLGGDRNAPEVIDHAKSLIENASK